MEQIRCLSMGAGVQTTAILIKFWERYKNGHIIFADTGDEHKETYDYIEKYLKPFCKEKGLRWETVKNEKWDSLLDNCEKKKIKPSPTYRWCTHDFKVIPIRKFIKKTYKPTKKEPVIQDIGISMDESHRIHSAKNEVQYLKTEYPLIDARLTRGDCYEIIKDYGWPLPAKSGCDWCFFQKKHKIRELLANDRERFARIAKMEQEALKNSKGQKIPMFGTPMMSMLQNGSMDGFMESESETCDSGHCFT